jgi:hypothetical protein|tara:strand:+ start:375 stop:674 length:300 start_codon:yes stop_codon:yes gene_type:complete
MQIDPDTGKVYYDNYVSPMEIQESLEHLKIKENKSQEEPVFSKTIHKDLKYGRLKFMCYCFLLMMDGIIGVVSFGQTQSIMAQKYLLSDWVMGDHDADR